jgi:hypothetical protein
VKARRLTVPVAFPAAVLLRLLLRCLLLAVGDCALQVESGAASVLVANIPADLAAVLLLPLAGCAACRWKQALRLLEVMWQCGGELVPDIVSYNTVMKACGNAQQTDTAFQVRVFP